MQFIGLDENTRSEFSNKIDSVGVEDATEFIVNYCTGSKKEFILNEFSRRHTAWIGLTNINLIRNAVVIETGIGASVISIAEIVDNVYALYLDEYTKNIVTHRVKSKNVHHILLEDYFSQLDIDWSSTLLIAYNDNNDETIRNRFYEILSSNNVGYYYYISKNNFKRAVPCIKHLNNKNINTYHIEGSARDPYKMISGRMKLKYFGLLKYVLFNLYMRYQHECIATTNLDIKKSLFNLICKKSFNNKEFNIEYILFVKPNGALLAVNHLNKKYMIRITSDALGKKRLLINNNALLSLKKNNISVVPELYKQFNFEGYFCSVEGCIDGNNISPNDIKNNKIYKQIYIQSTHLITSIHKKTTVFCLYDNDVYFSLFYKPIANARKLFSNNYSSVFDAIDIYFKKYFFDIKMFTVLNHGDYSADNIMIKNGTITGVIDWEYSNNTGLPLVDLIFLICNMHKKKNNLTIINALKEVAIDNNITQLEHDCVNNYCHSLNIPKEYIVPLGIMCVIHFMAYRLEVNEEFCRKSSFDEIFGNILHLIKHKIVA